MLTQNPVFRSGIMSNPTHRTVTLHRSMEADPPNIFLWLYSDITDISLQYGYQHT